ncbi:hypothetical protein D070_13405 [Bacillus velezensis]|uniref:hypothetical protein n=1 Tax=Bacillus velezensis TaxID=492670 RepID=UPI0011280C10|nr:hypothetical protein [Bacillus velezensis]QDF49571.1 hypothetical protein FIM06_2509 [Bacillus velezensis]QDF53217.1 hypothetical protein D069_2508 [Bacillus velezensis]
MGLTILSIAVAIGVAIFIIKSVGCGEFIDYVFGVFIGIIFGICTLLVLFLPAFFIQTVPTNPHKTEIYSIKDRSKTSGSFVLGSGTVDEEQYFYYVTEKDGFKTISKAPVEDSKMREGSYKQPYVITYDRQFKSSFARFFYGTGAVGSSYEFHLPKDTITTEYKIDLE